MEVFEYLGVLVSVVIGLAITHLVSGTTGVVQERDKIRIFWVHQVWVLNIFLYLAFFWWFFFGWAPLNTWSMGVFWLLLGYALVLSLLAGMLYPTRGAVNDFKEYFFRHHRWFFGLQVVAVAFDVAEVLLKAQLGLRAVPMAYFPFIGVVLIGSIVGMVTRSPMYHSLYVVFYLFWQLGYSALEFGPIG